MKLVDRNMLEVTDGEWNLAGLVIISGMIVQKDDMAVHINNAKQRGLPVAVGGPFASSTPDAPEFDLADFKILDEGEITLLEQFLSVLAHNEHFLEYRSIVQQEIREQLESLPPEEPTATKELQPA